MSASRPLRKAFLYLFARPPLTRFFVAEFRTVSSLSLKDVGLDDWSRHFSLSRRPGRLILNGCACVSPSIHKHTWDETYLEQRNQLCLPFLHGCQFPDGTNSRSFPQQIFRIRIYTNQTKLLHTNCTCCNGSSSSSVVQQKNNDSVSLRNQKIRLKKSHHLWIPDSPKLLVLQCLKLLGGLCSL